MLLFSHDIFAAQIAGGISRCMTEIARALPGNDVSFRVAETNSKNVHLQQAKRDASFDLRCVSVGTRISLPFLSQLSNERNLAALCNSSDTHILHRTYYAPFDFCSKSMARVETLHDMWEEVGPRLEGTHPKRYLKSHIKHRALARADAIICVSKATQNDLRDVWPELSSRSAVIPHGIRPLSDTPLRHDGIRPFLLFVGRREKYKNFSLCLNILTDNSQLSALDLICVGGGPLTTAEKKDIETANLGGRVRQVSANDDELAGFYMSATALVYPSAFEGFGMPLLEAMQYGCPVISSDKTSLPEVAGEAAILAGPDDVSAWQNAAAAVLENEALRSNLGARGRARASLFSWNAAAKAHADLYKTLAKPGSMRRQKHAS
ncbi:MAG: glycosyltransferase family 1 protein [Pacificimonas sp.]